jgi:hypothetical protein
MLRREHAEHAEHGLHSTFLPTSEQVHFLQAGGGAVSYNET